jgi:glucokinase
MIENQKADFIRSRALTLFTAMTLFAALAITVQTSAQSQMTTFDAAAKSKITTFEAPGAGTGAGQGTLAAAVTTGNLAKETGLEVKRVNGTPARVRFSIEP